MKAITLRKAIIFIFKVFFATSLILWLVKNGKLDFSLTLKTFQSSKLFTLLIVALFLLIIQDLLSAFRWKYILNAKSKTKLNNIDIIKITWVGLFFNNFLPGAVTGDFIKLIYVKKLDPELSKTYLITTILADRFFGLVGLLCIMGFTTLLYYNEVLLLSSEIQVLLHFNIFLFIITLIISSGLFVPPHIQKHLNNYFQKIPYIGKHILNLFQQLWVIGSSKKVIIKCVLISILSTIYKLSYFFHPQCSFL